MKIGNQFLLLAAACLIPVAPLAAAIQISFSFEPILQTGTDPFAVSGSPWTMNFGIEADSYPATSTFVVADTAELTIAGSASLDGTYFPVERNTGTFIITPRGGGGIDAILGASGWSTCSPRHARTTAARA